MKNKYMWNDSIQLLEEKRKTSLLGGGKERIEHQHALGKFSARERLELLFDKGTFCELGSFIQGRETEIPSSKDKVLGDGVVTGYGKVNGRLVFASSQDFTVIGGTLGEYHAKKICRIMDKAIEMKSPYVSINDSGGARIEEGIDSLSGYGDIFMLNTKASGVIPQISVIMGPCAGGAAYSPALTDFIFMVQKTSYMFLTGPAVIKSVTGEDVSTEDLGGAGVHMEQSGVCHFAYESDEECLLGVRKLLSYLPQSNGDVLPEIEKIEPNLDKNLIDIVPDNQRKGYDMRNVINEVVDGESLFEVQADFARNAVVAFARVDGKPVGVIANQPNYMGGSLDCNASDKIARFVRFCDCFGIPVLTFVDVPAFLPGVDQEQKGVIRHGAKILFAYAEANVPKVTVILRKAYGGAYIAMCSKGLGADVVYAWPTAQIAVIGAEGAVSIIYKKQILASSNPEEEKQRLVGEYESKFLSPYIAASRGFVDEVILPDETRTKIKKSLELLKSKQQDSFHFKKHGNMPT